MPIPVGPGRGNTEVIEVFRAQPAASSASTRFSTQFPLREGWLRLQLMLEAVIAVPGVAPVGALTDGLLRAIKGILFRTDKNEIISLNVPGRMLFNVDRIKGRTAPIQDAVILIAGTIRTIFNLWFIDLRMLNPLDTVLNTARYSSVELILSMGSVSDLWTTPNSATVTWNWSCNIERIKGLLPPEQAPQLYQEYGIRGPVTPATATLALDLERAANLGYKRLLIHATSGATAGVPMDGVGDNTIVSDMVLDVGDSLPYLNLQQQMVAEMNRIDYNLETRPAGLYVLDFPEKWARGSVNAAIYAGDKSRLQYRWTNQAGLPAGNQLTLGYEGVRGLLP